MFYKLHWAKILQEIVRYNTYLKQILIYWSTLSFI